MNMETFVENAKAICKNKNIAVSTACLNAGLSITWMSDIEKKHTRPRIDSVIAFAQYLGVTVSELLGETAAYPNRAQTPPAQTLTLHDSTVRLDPSDVKRLTVSEVEMVMAYRAASPEIRRVIDGALEPYKQKETTSAG